MENRLYPTWEQLAEQNNPLTEGERTLLKFLDDHLPRDLRWKKGDPLKDYDGWLIFAQPFLNGTRPDVVIFNPQVGIVIYEVKDWDLRHYQKDSGGKLSVSNRMGHTGLKDPVGQVRRYQSKLIGQLVPQIGEAVDTDKKQFALVRSALYFHKSTTARCQELFEGRVKSFKDFPVFGNDLLKVGNLDQVVPDVAINSSWYWNRRWNEDVLFWLKPPYHSIEQGTLLTLRGNQAKVAEPTPGHHRVRGVAGSGKTQALAYRAAKLASQGKDVLIITFNITLWHYIKDMIARAPFNFEWSRITFNHFHGFCRDKLFECGASWPEHGDWDELPYDQREKLQEAFFRSVVPNAVIEAIVGRHYQHYDAILIDEGQDYHYEWYALLDQHFLTARDEMLVVCDKRQNIFDRELDWLDKRVTKKGLEKFKGPYLDLTVTYRLPIKLAMITNEFSELFGMNQELKVGRFEENPVLMHSHHIVWLNIQEELWQEYIVNAFKRLKREGYSASDIVFLLPEHETGMVAVELFKKMEIEVNHVFDDKKKAKNNHNKRAFWMGDSRLKMSTIHSFKGWELLNIVLFISEKVPESDTNLDALVYTALTRTRENLIVLNAHPRYREFGEKLPKKYHEQ